MNHRKYTCVHVYTYFVCDERQADDLHAAVLGCDALRDRTHANRVAANRAKKSSYTYTYTYTYTYI